MWPRSVGSLRFLEPLGVSVSELAPNAKNMDWLVYKLGFFLNSFSF